MILLEDFWDCKTCNTKVNMPDANRHPLKDKSNLYDYDHLELCDRCLKRKEIKEVKRQMGVSLMCGWNYYGTYKELDKQLQALLRNEPIIKPLPNLLAVSASLELK